MLLEDLLMPVRFLVTVGQLLGTLSISFDKEHHILPALPLRYTKDQLDSANAEFTTALVLATLMLVLELLSLIGGLTYFNERVTVSHIWFHGAGCIFIIMFSLASAHFAHFWQLFLLTNLVPFIVEIGAIIGVFWLRMSPY
eukprot:gnl/MRDRNA2_/MRDRNA2_108082_c0_seq1.p1 gnl/MRDRNA2_/MRDRNA2_108082_c0~~gnl/MRDRNA2_/MRDRNA2_108082_c0_seq1.p1  ORF type:complete len:141 (+),score=13.19 gnl/MRDRNA2_/MRDRNA2_108082_c0_seq1:140-562(+)